jgi:glycosyltransferase involved in cell wall biosynthesis
MLMTEKPLVSIVTPSFNQGKFLEETILSVLNQNYERIEYIIIDGASNDDSPEIIKKYKDRLAYSVSEPDKGQTDAINKGFSHAKGQILAWINSDDVYAPDAIRNAVEYLTAHPEIGMVYGDLDFIDENGRVIGKFNASQTDLPRLRRGYVHIPQPSTFFRADLWRKVGPLDPTFFFAMDYDLWTRLAAISTFKYLPGKAWAKFRLHSSGKTVAADDRCWPDMLRVHFRDGGKRFAPIVLKYWIRKLAAPFINWKRKQMFK